MAEILYLVAVKITAPTAVLPALAIFANDYFKDNLSDESYYLPYPVMWVKCNEFSLEKRNFTSRFIFIWRLPFNYKNMIGYSVAMVGQAFGEYCLMLCASTFIVFFVGACWSFISFIDDIAIELSCVKADGRSSSNQLEIRNHFCKIVQLFSDVKQLSWKAFLNSNESQR